MLKHMVMCKKRADVADATVDEIIVQLEALVGQVPGLRDLMCHRALPSDRPIAHTFLLDSTLDSLADLPVYLAHPAHVVVAARLAETMEARAVVDYEA